MHKGIDDIPRFQPQGLAMSLRRLKFIRSPSPLLHTLRAVLSQWERLLILASTTLPPDHPL